MAIITPFQEQSGPEQYAPPDQRSPKNLNDIDQVVNAFEDTFREFAPALTAPARKREE